MRSNRQILAGLLRWGVAAVFMLPLWWVLVASLRPTGLALPKTLEWIPNWAGWSNYQRVFELVPLTSQFKNSLFVELWAVPLTLLVASWAGFAMSTSRPQTQQRLLILAVLLMLVPSTALWLTRFLLFKYLGLMDSLWALIAPALAGTTPLYTLLFYWSFRRLPKAFFETARLEGATPMQVWARIALPLSLPTLLTVGVLSFSFYWSDLMSPLLYLKSEENYTLPVGLSLLQQMHQAYWPYLMAASLMVILPILLAFILLQRLLGFEGRIFHHWNREDTTQ